MLIIGLLFLMPTAILSSNYRAYGNHQAPMDYGDVQNRDFVHNGVKPGSNLIFNFEQLRRDQPPQIEMRDESLGLYMHRRPQTTTAAAPMVVPEFKTVPENTRFGNNGPFSRYSNLPAHVNNNQERQSTPIYQLHPNSVNTTPMPSPPPAPQWSDFSETFKKQSFPHYGSHQSFEQKMPSVPEFNHFQQPQQHQPSRPIEKPYEQTIPSAPQFNHFQQPQHQSTVEKENSMNYDYRRNSVPQAYSSISTTPEYKSHNYGSTRNMENGRQQQNIANRGSHKFGWNDLVTEPSWNHQPQQMTSTLAPNPQGQNPPPIPTLTPWLDGFGK